MIKQMGMELWYVQMERLDTQGNLKIQNDMVMAYSLDSKKIYKILKT
jgi:hypothetical protein